VSPASSTSSSSTSTSTPSSPLEPHTTTVSSRAGRDTISSLNSAFDGAPGASWVDLGPPYLFLDDDDHESDDENTMAVDTWPRLPPHDASASGSETTNYKLND
jgi:hypothetical protein